MEYKPLTLRELKQKLNKLPDSMLDIEVTIYQPDSDSFRDLIDVEIPDEPLVYLIVRDVQ